MNTIQLKSEIERSPRVMKIEGMFDIQASSLAVTEIPLNIPNLEEKPWNIGLIVGPSGSGKSTVAKNLFQQQLETIENLEWSSSKAIVDCFPKEMSIKEITELLSSVGFSSPPAWLRPFHTLSNGEQFRVSLARIIAEQKELAVIDEFTSVVDRTVAKIGSHAVAKTIRKRNQRFIAISCHDDVIDWLQPDWIYEPASGSFLWRSLQRRPPIDVQIIQGSASAWQYFARHHYLDHSINKSAYIFVALIQNKAAAFAAILSFPHPHLKNSWKISRIVVHPDFQGIGLAGHFLDLLGGGFKANKKILDIVTSHPAMIAALNSRPTWAMNRKPSRTTLSKSKAKVGEFGTASSRITASFRYCGPEKPEAQLITTQWKKS